MKILDIALYYLLDCMGGCKMIVAIIIIIVAVLVVSVIVIDKPQELSQRERLENDNTEFNYGHNIEHTDKDEY